MSPARVFRQRLLMCLGLAMVIAGGTAASMGYLAATDARSRGTLVITPQSTVAEPTTKKAAVSPTTKRSRLTKSGRTIASRRGTATTKHVTRKPSATTRSAAVITVDANGNADASVKVAGRYRGMMWWGGAMLVVGLASVGYSIHERRPKPPPSGADELLNDAPPF